MLWQGGKRPSPERGHHHHMPLTLNQRLTGTSLASYTQVRVIFAVVVVLIIALAVTAPYAAQATHGTEILLPAYAAADFVVEITTAALLFAIFQVRRAAPLLILAAGYLLSAMLVVPWALTFPGVFSSLGWDYGLQPTAWIAAVRRIGFAAAVVAYGFAGPTWGLGTPERWITGSVGLVCVCTAATIWLAVSQADGLPVFMADARHTTGDWRSIPAMALALYALGIATVLARRRSMLDIWVSVVLFSLVVEIFLISYLGGAVRLSVGWWSGRFFGLAAAGTMLLVLLSETIGSHTRLAQVAAREQRARRNRMVAMEALSASIAHEINQPLASMVTNANAGMRWLARHAPEIGQAEAALRRIVEEGHRADKIVSGIRTMFLKGAQERVAVDLKCVIAEALAKTESERALAGVEVSAVYPRQLRMVTGNPVQLLQVVSNLIDNAIDAMKEQNGRVGRLTIRIEDGEPGEVNATFADTGPGISADAAERIFLPFVSTKPDGMGMGLMFCRSVIEAHGGRLWVAANGAAGAVFCFSLPAADQPDDDKAGTVT
jgi:signal transduction histidine kinase